MHSKRTEVLTRVERLIWDEYDKDDAEELSEEANWRLADLSLADDFLDTPLETLIQRLADDIGLGRSADEPDREARLASPSGGKRPDGEAEWPKGGVALCETGTPAATSPPPSATRPCGASRRFPPEGETAAAEPEPPPRPPDPPPEEPYVPPWERLRPGQYMRDSGW